MKKIEKIIKDCASGNVRAQEKIYRMYAPKMFGVCLRYAKDRTEAEDNLQEGFVKVFTNVKKFRFEGSFEGWIRRIMVNVSLSKLRKKNVMYPVEEIEEYQDVQFSQDILAKIEAKELMNLVQELPPRYKMVFNLFVIEGMSHREISKKMDISIGTSKSNLARARNILKKEVVELYEEVKTNTNYSA